MSGQREGSAPVRPQPAWLSDLPGMLAQWHPTGNGPLDPLTLRVGSHRRVWWRCAQGHEWQAKVGSRTRRETGCPVCSGRRVSPARNLAALYPEVAATWHPTANAPLTPDEVSPASGKRVWWRCAAGHEWQVAVANRVMYDCPFCSGRRVTAATSLAALYPNVAREWHPSRNGTRTPETVKPRSSIPVWWQCAREHSWETTVNSRTTSKTGCPYCTGKRPWSEHNLAVVRPELAREWHPTRNGTVTAHSSHRAWWRCDDCGHEWQASVNNRARGAACPACALAARVLR